jgi:hypothetical protein
MYKKIQSETLERNQNGILKDAQITYRKPEKIK